MSITKEQMKKFRTIGHRLNPVIIVTGKPTETVTAEIERALEEHELIKVKFNVADRELKKTLVNEINQSHKSELVQLVGHIALIFRPAKSPDPRLSNLLRHQM